ncbi:putative membrane protein [Arthrobacter sp. 2762]
MARSTVTELHGRTRLQAYKLPGQCPNTARLAVMRGHATARETTGTFLPDVRAARANIGGWAQLSVVQYFVAESAVIEAWAGPQPYSRATGFISDLGAVSCGVYEDRAVCSPLHVLMNASFVVQGLALILGAVFLTAGLLCVAARPGVHAQRFHTATADEEPRTRVLAKPWIIAVAIRILTGVSGTGTVIVGLVPEDVGSPWHFAGALMFFIGGGFALLLLGILWFRQTPMSWFIAACGSLCIGALIVGGITGMEVPQPGTLERLMGYPVTIGLAAAGLVIAQRVHTVRRAAKALR